MRSVVKKGYAKINLHLDITGIMENGYHSVQTVMQSLSLCDDVTVSLRDDGIYSVTSNVSGVPTDDKNLAVKAAMALEKKIGKRIGADIHIEKRIPMAAGLAGGSADAAATLKALNELLGEPLTLAQLCEIGSTLGADVPFCIVGGSAYADGKGDLLYPFPSLCDCIVVVACGGEGVSTPWAYRSLDEKYNNFSEGSYSPKGVSRLENAMKNRDISAICANMYNIFEEPILNERYVAKNIKDIITSSGAVGAMMSGSGPSIFGLFLNEHAAESAVERIRDIYGEDVSVNICRPVRSV